MQGLQGRHDAVQEKHDEAAEELEYLEVRPYIAPHIAPYLAPI